MSQRERDVILREEPIELYKLLKLENLVASGGEAKFVIAEGMVLVNGAVETRKRKKITAEDMVEFGETTMRISTDTIPGAG